VIGLFFLREYVIPWQGGRFKAGERVPSSRYRYTVGLKSSALRSAAVWTALSWAVAATRLLGQAPPAQTCRPGDLRVIVIDSQESRVFDASVRVRSATSTLDERSTQTVGSVDFSGVTCGSWSVTVTKEGFEPSVQTVEITGAPNTEISVVLTPRMQTTTVEVLESSPLVVEQSASSSNKLEPVEVKKLPTNPATVNDALPLEPGVVRAPDGEIRIAGSGQERSAMVVNQTDITDPATGKFGPTVPVDSVETVNVLTTPFLAQYGRFTQSVIAIETKRGGENWHAELNDPFPEFRIRSYHMNGIRDATPRFVLGGPLIKEKLYFNSAIQYSFKSPSSRTLPYPDNISRQESVNSFTQVDYVASPKQILTASFHYNPQHINFVNPEYFNPQPVTPSFGQKNIVGTLSDRWGVLDGILESSISFQRFDVNIGAQGNKDMVLTPLGNYGNYFGLQKRSAGRFEWLENWSLPPVDFLGTHLLKMGTSVTHSTDEGRFNYHSIEIHRADDVLAQRIDFSTPAPFNRADLEVTAYVQDHWSILPNLSFDLGGRLEHQRLPTSFRIAPRAGFAWNPFSDQRTVFRVGYGLFYDRLPLDIYTFARYPERTVTNYAPDGSMIGDPIHFTNVIGSITGPRSFFINGKQVAGAFSPRGGALNLQLEHIFSSFLRVRGTYLDSQSVGLVVLEAAQNAEINELVLNGNGKSRYRQFELNARFNGKDGQQLIFSYARSRAQGTLNNYDSFLGNYPAAVVHPNLYSNLPGDVPNRLLLWGLVKTHIWKLDLAPLVEFRSGFAYAQLDEMQNYAGVPYRDSTRFPHVLTVDARIARDFKVSPKYTVRLSGTVTNLTNHFNPLAVHNNIADPQSGIFFGNYHRMYRGDFDIIF
jgi:hypothetical protein